MWLYTESQTGRMYKSFRRDALYKASCVATYREPDGARRAHYIEPDGTHQGASCGYIQRARRDALYKSFRLHVAITESQAGRINKSFRLHVALYKSFRLHVAIYREPDGALYKSFRLYVAIYREPDGTHYINHSGFMWLYTESQTGRII